MKPFNFLYIFIVAATLLTTISCSSNTDEPSGIKYEKIQLTPTEEQITIEGNTFAFNLFKALNEGRENENTFISPYSLAQVLAMLANGAQGETYDEIVKVLGISHDITEVNNYYKHLRDALPRCAPKTEISTSNFFVYDNDVTIFDDFMKTCTEYYGTGFKSADFGSSDAIDIVNKWVSNATSGKIPFLFSNPSSISGFCVLNATYFDGWWANPFDKKDTHNNIFHNYKNISESVPMMYQDLSLEHYTDSDYVSLLKIPYYSRNFEMDILLPNRDIDINEYISELNLDDFNYMLDNASTNSERSTYTIGLPKFSGKFNYDMTAILRKMGIEKAFFPGAEFGNITTKKITAANTRQSTIIEVDEHGTKAVAASEATDELISVHWNEFIVDSPFIYIIRECSSGAILFIGKTVSIKQFSY